jgi:RNA polymerase sigma factor (sigma-70 family)
MNAEQLTLKQIWDTYYPRVYGYFYKRINNKTDVEDISCIVMTVLLDNIQTKTIENIPIFMWSVARNQFKKYLRNKNSHHLHVMFTENIEDIGVEEQFTISPKYKEYLENVLEYAKTKLSPDDYKILEETYFSHKNSKEIAILLHTTSGNIRVRQSRILKKLKIHAQTLIS